MKKQIYLTVISAITVLVILFSILGRNGVLPFRSFFTDEGKTSDTLSLDAFSNIEMNMSVTDLKLEYNDEGIWQARYEVSSEKLVPAIRVQDNTLHVDQEKVNASNTANYKCELTISVPKDTALQKITMELGVGDITVKDIKADELNLNAGVGDVKFKDTSLANADLKAGVGDIKISGSSVTVLDLEEGVGDVEISDIADLNEYTLDITVGIGDLSINGDKKSGFGKEYKQQSGDGSHKYKITSGTGNIKLTN